ncbi:MAG: DUF4974 domain-containing protein [Cyclobacteriaceae bacterium]|nr:DUF4974 domain-containing protein [Cyclobacteriaceae bacterium]
MDKSTLIHRVLIGKASEEEIADLERWMSLDPDNATEFEDMKLLYSDSQETEDDSNDSSKDSWKKIEDGIHRLQTRERRINSLKMVGAATGIYVLIIFGYNIFGTDRASAMDDGLLTQTLHYRDARIRDVMHSIEENSHFNVTLASSELEACKFTGSFKGGTSIREVIETLAKAKDLNVRYTSEQAVVLNGNPCKM